MSARRDWRSDLVNVVAAAVVALLVWAYANDRTRETATLAGTVRLAVADPRAQYVEPSAAITVSVELRGSRRSIERAERALRAGVALAPGTDGLPGEPGTHEARLQGTLQLTAAIAETGAEVVRVRPETASYTVGTLVTEQVPVSPLLPSAAVQGEIAIDPAVVSVTLPSEARAAVGRLAVDAIVETKNLEPGKTQQVDVDLRLPESLARWNELCRVVPPRAKVTFALLSTNAQYTIPSVPVRVSMSPATASAWDVVPVRAQVSGVVVTGPRAAIDALKSGTFVPAAVVDLGDGMPAAGRSTLAVTLWRLPEGVSVGEAADTVVFCTIAFYGVITGADFLNYVIVGYLYKTLLEVVLLPITYPVIRAIKRREPTYGLVA